MSGDEIDVELREQQLSRSYALLGADAMNKLQCARVALVGAGAVMAHTALHLARSGVRHIVLVAPSSARAVRQSLLLNPCVRRADVAAAVPLVDCVRQRVQEIWSADSQRSPTTVEHVESLAQLFAPNRVPVQAVAMVADDSDDNDDDDGASVVDDVRLCAATHAVPTIVVVGASWRGAADVTRLKVSSAADSAIDDWAARRIRRLLLLRDVRSNVALVHANQSVKPTTAVQDNDDAAAAAIATTLGSVVASQVIACVAGTLPVEWCGGGATTTTTTTPAAAFAREARERFGRQHKGVECARLTAQLVEYVIDCMWNQRSAWSRRGGKSLSLAVIERGAPIDQFNVLPLLDDELAAFNAEGGGLAALTPEQQTFVHAVFAHERRLQRAVDRRET